MMQIRESGENPNFRPNFVPQYFCEFYLYWLNIVPNWLNIGSISSYTILRKTNEPNLRKLQKT